MSGAARLVFPALRWRASTGFGHEAARIDGTLRIGVGGYILFGGRSDDVRRLTASLQSASAHPLLIGSDLERGAAQQFEDLTHLPPAAALGFLRTPELSRRCGEITAREARSVGVNWVYGPVADLDVEPDNPIVQTRSFGDDPAAVAGMVAAWVAGAQEGGVAATVKHGVARDGGLQRAALVEGEGRSGTAFGHGPSRIGGDHGAIRSLRSPAPAGPDSGRRAGGLRVSRTTVDARGGGAVGGRATAIGGTARG